MSIEDLDKYERSMIKLLGTIKEIRLKNKYLLRKMISFIILLTSYVYMTRLAFSLCYIHVNIDVCIH